MLAFCARLWQPFQEKNRRRPHVSRTYLRMRFASPFFFILFLWLPFIPAPESSAVPWHVGPLQWVPRNESPYNITREVFPTPLHPLSLPKSGGNFNRYPKGTHPSLKITADPFSGILNHYLKGRASSESSALSLPPDGRYARCKNTGAASCAL